MDRKTKAALIKAVCATTTDRATLDIARWWEMTPGGQAALHLDHYLAGSGAELTVDLAKVLQDDGGVRRKVQTEVIAALRQGKASGTVAIPQSTYKVKDWHLAIGSMNINWTYPSPHGPDRVHIGFRNEYRWHPKDARITQCIHQAADRLKTHGAKDYWMTGKTELVLSLADTGAKTPRFHATTAGDTLAKLALRYYKDSNRWREIHAANKARLPDPNRLSMGMVLEVP
ncbi:MAG TPA: hypothetical protein VF384_19705 [Planctomycetota bacterium]